MSLTLALAAAGGGGCSLLVEGELVDKPADGAGGEGGDASTAAQTSTAAHGSAAQSSSTGGFMCKEGTANCNGVAWDGCEAKLAADPFNCGACKAVCKIGTKCEAGKCK